MFCTYLTIYNGKFLPKWYIGSTSVEKINKGYRGSIRSKKYKFKWSQELKEHPELFKTVIIKIFETRKEALQSEYEYQVGCDVVKSEDYINQSLAIPNGFFGMKPNKHTEVTKQKMHKPKSKEHAANISIGRKGIVFSEETRKKMSLAKKGMKSTNKGKIASEETRRKLSESHKGQIAWNKGLKYSLTAK